MRGADTLGASLNDSVYHSDSLFRDSLVEAVMDSLQQSSVIISHETAAPSDTTDATITAVICFTAILAVSLFLLFGPKNQWVKGKFPYMLRYNPKNVQAAYMCLGIAMLKRDRTDLRETMHYLRDFLNSRFKEGEPTSTIDLQDVIKLQVTVESVVSWLLKKMPKDQHLEVIRFLVDMSYFNEDVTRSELELIYGIGKRLGIPIEKIDQEVRNRKEKAIADHNEHLYMGRPMREHCLEILELPHNAAWEQVEAQFRELVTRFQPELFLKLAPHDQETALKQFQQMEKAFRYLKANW